MKITRQDLIRLKSKYRISIVDAPVGRYKYIGETDTYAIYEHSSGVLYSIFLSDFRVFKVEDKPMLDFIRVSDDCEFVKAFYVQRVYKTGRFHMSAHQNYSKYTEKFFHGIKLTKEELRDIYNSPVIGGNEYNEIHVNIPIIL